MFYVVLCYVRAPEMNQFYQLLTADPDLQQDSASLQSLRSCFSKWSFLKLFARLK